MGWSFSVYLKSADNGRRLGSRAASASRYWFITPSRHARSQLSGIGPVDAFAPDAAMSAKTTRVERMEASPGSESILEILSAMRSYLFMHFPPRRGVHTQCNERPRTQVAK